MNSLTDPNIENIPGLESFKFAPTTYFQSIGEPLNHIINSISWQAGKDWLDGFSLPGLLTTNEKPDETEHGHLYSCDLNGLIPTDTASLVAQLHEMKQYRFIVAYKDLGGNYKLMGSLESPCKFNFELVKSNEANHYNYNFNCVKADSPLYFLNSSQY